MGTPKAQEILRVPSTARSRERGGGSEGAHLHPDHQRRLFLPVFFLFTLSGSQPGLKQADASSVRAAFPPRSTLVLVRLGMLLC